MTIYVPEGENYFDLVWANTQLDKNVTVSIGIRDLTPGDIRDVNDVADDLYDGLVGDDAGHLCNAAAMAVGWSFLGVEGFQASDSGPILGSHLETVTGSGSDNDVPVNTCVLVKKNTASGGRKNRGRWFLPPMMAGLETDTGGFLAGVGTAFIDAQLLELMEHLSNINLAPVLFHTQHAPPAADPSSTIITSFSTQPKMATQRRRLR